MKLNIEAEEDDVSVLHPVLFSFQTDLSMFFQCGFGMILHEILIAVDFRPDKSFFKIGMNDSRALRCLHSLAERPGPAFRLTDSEEGSQTKQMIGSLNDLVKT